MVSGYWFRHDPTMETVTTTDIKPPITHRKPGLAYYWRVLKWIVKHREEPNCRQKWRRMDREIKQEVQK